MTARAGEVARAALRRPALLGAIGLAAAYFCVVTWLCKIEYDCFFYGFDLAWYANLLASGKDKWPLFSTLHQSWFGDHFEPIDALLVPAFRLFPTVWTLLVVQTAAFAAVPVLCFLLAAALLDDERHAFLVAAIALANPALWYLNLDDFHPTVFAIPLVLGYFLALQRRHSGWACLALGLLLLCKEDAALLVVPLCAAHYLAFRRARPAALMAAVAVAAFAALNLWLLPAIGSSPPLLGWTYLGGSVGEVVATIASHPALVAARLFADVNAEYLLEILLPWGFASLLDWRLCLALPVFLTFALSSQLPRHTIASQAAATIVPLAAVSALYGLRRVRSWLPRSRPGDGIFALALVAVFAIGAASFARPLPTMVASRPYVRLVGAGPRAWVGGDLCPERERLAAIVRLVPADRDLALVARMRLAPRFVHHARLQIYDWLDQPPSDYGEYDLILGSRVDQSERPRRRPGEAQQRAETAWAALLADPRWEEIYRDPSGDFVLRNRRTSAAPRS